MLRLKKLTRLPDGIAGTGGCRPKMLRLSRLLRVSIFQPEIAESPSQDCRDCNGDCRPTLQRLQRLLRLPRLKIFPRLPRSPRLSPKIAGTTDFAGRECVIACWDRKKWRGCQTGLTWSQSLPPKIAEIAEVAGSEESAEFAVRNCQDPDGECRPTLRRLQRLLRLPRMQILARLPRSPRFSPEIAGSADIAGQEWMIACWDWKNWRGCRTGLPGLQTAAQKCRDCRGCWECRIFSPRLPEVLAKIVEIATEVAGRHCRDCRDCRSAEIADISNPVRSPRLPPKLAGIANIAGRECVIACWDRKKWRGCQTGLTWSQSLPPKIAEIAEVAGSEESADFADRICQDCDGECRPTLRELQRLPRLQILARLPRSPRFSPEIAGSADIAGQEWMIASWDWKNWRGCRTGLPGLQTAAQKCRDCRGCWECRIFSPRLPEVLAKIVEIATEVAGRHCRDCRDCRSAEIADISNPVRSPRLPPKLAGIANIAGRECVIACWDRKKWRGCQTGLTWSQSLPPKIAEIAEVAGSEESAEFAVRNCQDPDGECRPTLRRLQRLLRLPRMQILARLPRSPQFSPEIAGSADIAGQEWMIACWDWKNWRGCRTGLPGLQILARLPRSPRLSLEIAGITDFAGREWVIACWDWKKWRGCQTGLTWSQSLPPKIAEIAEVAGREESAKFADRICQDCDGECRPTLRRLQRLLRLPRMQILARLPRSPRFSPEIAGSADIAGQEWMIACWDWKNWRGCRMGLPGLEAAAQKCWDCQGCWECRFFSRRLPKVLAKIVEIATEIAGRHCRDCRDCWDCRDWRYFQDCRDRRDCRPRLPGLPTLPVENVWLHAETEKNDEVARRD